MVTLGVTQKAIMRLLRAGVTDVSALAARLQMSDGNVRKKMRTLISYGMVARDGMWVPIRYGLLSDVPLRVAVRSLPSWLPQPIPSDQWGKPRRGEPDRDGQQPIPPSLWGT